MDTKEYKAAEKKLGRGVVLQCSAVIVKHCHVVLRHVHVLWVSIAVSTKGTIANITTAVVFGSLWIIITGCNVLVVVH